MARLPNSGPHTRARPPKSLGGHSWRKRHGNHTPASYHNNACGFGFADGHAEIHKWRDSQTLAPIQGPGRQNPWAGIAGVNGTGTTSVHDNAWMAARTTAPK